MSLQGEYQRKLYKELMKNYNPLERPVANDSQPLTVSFSLSLRQIMDVVHLFSNLACIVYCVLIFWILFYVSYSTQWWEILE